MAEDMVIRDIGAGKGHLSTVHLVESSKHGKAIIRKAALHLNPKVLVSPIAQNRLTEMHSTEVNVYKLLMKYKDKIGGMLHPMIIEIEEDNSILMEFVDCQHIWLWDNLSVDQLIEPVKHLAKLHAMTFVLSEEEKAMIPEHMIDSWFAELFSEKNLANFQEHMRHSLIPMVGEEYMEIIDKTIPQILSEQNLKALNDDCKTRGIAPLLCHGDAWPANCLFSKDREFLGWCDFQTANLGNPAQDLARLFASAMNGTIRRENYKHLLSIYYSELKELCTPGFDFETLLSSYQTFEPLAAAVVIAPTAGKLMANIHKINNPLALDIAMEKYKSLLDDLKSYQGRIR